MSITGFGAISDTVGFTQGGKESDIYSKFNKRPDGTVLTDY